MTKETDMLALADEIEKVIAELRWPPCSSAEYVPSLVRSHLNMIAKLSSVGIAIRAAAAPAPDGDAWRDAFEDAMTKIEDAAKRICLLRYDKENSNENAIRLAKLDIMSARDELLDLAKSYARPAPDAGVIDREAEVDRIMSMSDENILAEARSQGLDPEKIAANGRAALDRAVAIVDANSMKEMRNMLERCRVILANMAMENEGAIFNRWSINHEPLRADARNILSDIDEVLENCALLSQRTAGAGEPVAWLTEKASNNWMNGTDAENHVLLRRGTQTLSRIALYAHPAPSGRDPATIEACAKLADVADKSTHPAELADRIRALAAPAQS